MNGLLPDLPAFVLTEAGARRASHGNEIKPEDIVPPAPGTVGTPQQGPIRLLDASGRLLGIAREAGKGALRPAVVLV